MLGTISLGIIGVGLFGIYLLSEDVNLKDQEFIEANTPKGKHPHMQAVFLFFDDVKKGNVEEKQGDVYEFDFINKNVRVRFNKRLNLREKTLLHIYVNVNSDCVFSITYDESNGTFRDFKDKERILAEDEMDAFIAEFQSLIAQYKEAVKQQNKTVLLNQKLKEKETIKVFEDIQQTASDWRKRISQITDPTIRMFLEELDMQLEAVHNDPSHRDAEDMHRLTRLEQSILPDVLSAFCLLEAKEQENRANELLTALEKAKEIVDELQQKAHQQKAFAFEKNIELLKNI